MLRFGAIRIEWSACNKNQFDEIYLKVDDVDQQFVVKSQALQPQDAAETQTELDSLSLHGAHYVHNVIRRLDGDHYIFYSEKERKMAVNSC